MNKGRCMTCRYSESHDYLRDRYYCRNRDCVCSHYSDREEELNCDKWEENRNLSGYCKDCGYGTLKEETGKYHCSCRDTRNLYSGYDVDSRYDCIFWTAKVIKQQ